MNKEMVNVLIKRMEKEGVNEKIRDITFFKNLPNNLIRLLLGLDKESFKKYIIFIAKIQNKNLINCNSDILISISQMFVLKIQNLNAYCLMNLLVNTNILNNKDIIEFSSILLQIEDYAKLEATKTVFLRIKNLDVANIINIIGIIERSKNLIQLNLLIKLLINNELRSNKYFNHLIEMFLRNPHNNNLVAIEKCLHNRELLQNRNRLFLLKEYLLNSKDQEQTELISNIITDKNMLNSRNLIKVLDVITKLGNEKYYPIIKKMVSNKSVLKDSVFEDVLNAILKTQNDLQINAIMSLLKYPKLLSDQIQTAFILEKYLLITKKYQFIALDKLIEKNIDSDNFNLYSNDYFKIIEGILETKESYKAYCLANSSQDIINYKYANIIITAILDTTNPLICQYITLLLTVRNLKESDNFLKIFDSLFKCHNEMQMKAVVTLAKYEKIINSNKYSKLFNIIRECNEQQIAAVLKIIDIFDNIEDEILFRYLANILSEKNNSKIDVLKEVIVNHEILGQEKTLEYIALLKNSEKDDYKNILETLKKEFQELNITTEIKSKKRIFKLGRK